MIVYVTDAANHRVMSWPRGAVTGMLVAGGHGAGKELHQLSCPGDVAIDQRGVVYVMDVHHFL